MRRYSQPKIIATDELRSHGAAMKDIGSFKLNRALALTEGRQLCSI
jgi:hypothetical protein